MNAACECLVEMNAGSLEHMSIVCWCWLKNMLVFEEYCESEWYISK